MPATMPERVELYYALWKGKSLGNPADDDMFYWFVKVALDEVPNANEAWLRPYLEVDLKKYPDEIKKQCSLFQLLANFSRAKNPAQN